MKANEFFGSFNEYYVEQRYCSRKNIYLITIKKSVEAGMFEKTIGNEELVEGLKNTQEVSNYLDNWIKIQNRQDKLNQLGL